MKKRNRIYPCSFGMGQHTITLNARKIQVIDRETAIAASITKLGPNARLALFEFMKTQEFKRAFGKDQSK